jgi:hypothetical protein
LDNGLALLTFVYHAVCLNLSLSLVHRDILKIDDWDKDLAEIHLHVLAMLSVEDSGCEKSVQCQRRLILAAFLFQ